MGLPLWYWNKTSIKVMYGSSYEPLKNKNEPLVCASQEDGCLGADVVKTDELVSNWQSYDYSNFTKRRT